MDVIAEFLAVIVGAIALVAAWRAYRVSQGMRQDEQRRERQAQAIGISAWMSYAVHPDRDESSHNGINLLNSSSAAIYDVVITATTYGTTEHTFSASVCPPGEYFARWIHPSHRQRTNWAWELLSPLNDIADYTRPYSRSDKWKVTSLTFTDGAGTRWTHEDRRLTELS
ncbi:MAG: hypothetical protein ACTJHU_08075 [Mycetocola sp.]